MNVIISNKNQLLLENLGIDVIKDLNGEYRRMVSGKYSIIYKIVKNESIKEDIYVDKYKLMHDKASELAQDRAKIDFVSKMNPQDLVNYAVKAIKRNDADISDVENMLNKANYTPGQIEDLLDMIRTMSNVASDAVVAAIIADNENEINYDLLNNPDAC